MNCRVTNAKAMVPFIGHVLVFKGTYTKHRSYFVEKHSPFTVLRNNCVAVRVLCIRDQKPYVTSKWWLQSQPLLQ